MTSSTDKQIEGVKAMMDTIFSALRALRTIAPEYRWKGLGNVLGDFGECMAIDHYKLTKAPPGSEGFDAITKDGKKVQIKANHAAKQIGYRGEPDIMLVIQVDDIGNWKELYYGDFKPVREQSNYSARDNKYVITISKLKQLSKRSQRTQKKL